ncbi:DEKNAAC103132 [Brettanomyces naardenensis]|uniref:DEKNAAC103132 n=1 Tax=Brettanomyces naardenensis TaxID=13370 RepID=A0A448YMI0_BRENA|nr:DEKNAAC103132 [Brettanomyces naardenensis]
MSSLDELKQLGREAFSANQYLKAVDIYTDAIHRYGGSPVLYSNRAMSQIKLQNWPRALSDCNSGLAITNDDVKIHVKLLWRKAVCLSKLRRLDEAERALLEAKNLEPNNVTVNKELDVVRQKIHESNGMVELEIKDVDRLPAEFSKLDPTVANEVDPDAMDLDEELSKIDGVSLPKAKKPTTFSATIPSPAPSSSSSSSSKFPSHPSVYFLSTLSKKVTPADQVDYYTYVLGLDSSIYESVYKSTGVNADFLVFYVDAALNDLESPNPRFSAKIARDIDLFTRLPRFVLTSMYVSSAKSNKLLQLIQQSSGVDLHNAWR